jgi:hypothetical protein
MVIDSLSLTTASEWDRCCKDELSYIDNNLNVNNRTIKTFKSSMIEDSLMIPHCKLENKLWSLMKDILGMPI